MGEVKVELPRVEGASKAGEFTCFGVNGGLLDHRRVKTGEIVQLDCVQVAAACSVLQKKQMRAILLAMCWKVARCGLKKSEKVRFKGQGVSYQVIKCYERF